MVRFIEVIVDHVARGAVSDFSEVFVTPASHPVTHQRRDDNVRLRVRETRMQSGIALTLFAGQPVAPEQTAARRRDMALKRALDVVLAGSALLLLALPLLCIGLAVKLTSPGPVLFRQARVGKGGKLFTMVKFRTVRIEETDSSGHAQLTTNDSRLTPIGGWLRGTSIDELPQLLNVLKGDMSLVGPRPMVLGQRVDGRDFREVVPYYDFRSTMKPGLSGWAQANGLRGPTDSVETSVARIDHDCAYIQNFSLKLDVIVIIKTLRSQFLSGSGI